MRGCDNWAVRGTEEQRDSQCRAGHRYLSPMSIYVLRRPMQCCTNHHSSHQAALKTAIVELGTHDPCQGQPNCLTVDSKLMRI